MAGAVLTLAVVAIGWGSILVRLCDAPPLTIAFLRVGFATLLLAPFAFSTRPRRGLSGSGWGLSAAIAGLLLAAHFATWIASLAYTTIAASTLLVSTQPIFTLVLSRLILRERAGRRAFAATGIALAGVALVVFGDLRSGGGRLVGDLLALVGALCAAGYLVIGRRARGAVTFPVYFATVNMWAAIGAGLLALLARQPLLPAARGDLGWCLMMALVPHLLGHGGLNWAVRRMRAYLVNLTVLGEPILASVYAFVIFNERPPVAVYPGALLIGVGVALAFSDRSAREGASDGL